MITLLFSLLNRRDLDTLTIIIIVFQNLCLIPIADVILYLIRFCSISAPASVEYLMGVEPNDRVISLICTEGYTLYVQNYPGWDNVVIYISGVIQMNNWCEFIRYTHETDKLVRIRCSQMGPLLEYHLLYCYFKY